MLPLLVAGRDKVTSIETAPTHVAGLPVAVNVSCHVTRRASAEL